jgi:hypothetical protein
MTDDALTLRASGPAEATLTEAVDGVEVATTTEVELRAELAIDADWLTEHGYVSKRSAARLYADDVAEVVCAIRSDETAFAPREGWTLELAGAFETWATVAVDVADEVVAVGSDTKRANAACLALDGLAEHAVDDRPRLVMLDICGRYDLSDFSREKLLSELSASAETTPESAGADATATGEVTADD